MSRTFRGGLIGCGFFAQNHLHGWAGIDGADIVAICDRDAARLQETGDRFGIAGRYRDVEEMLRSERLDFVDIATLSNTHRELVEIAAPHTSAIICQKPMADTMADAQAMVDAAERASIPLLIHENFRWQRTFRELHRMLETGVIGTPYFGRISFRHGYSPYEAQPYLAQIERFSLMDMGLHLFDLTRHLMGEATTLTCRTQRLNPIVKGEDAFTALIGHAGGATSVVECSYYSKIVPDPFPQTAAWIEGDSGTLAVDTSYRVTLHKDGQQRIIDADPPTPPWGDTAWRLIQDSVIAFETHVVDVLAGRTTPQPSGRDNLNTLRMSLAAYDSAASDRVIDLASWVEN